MAGFEYKLHQRSIRMDAEGLEKLFNEFANDGWRFREIDQKAGIYVFERGISGRRPKAE